MPKTLSIAALMLVTASTTAGCSGASARHLQYDYGRAFSEAVVAQADLTRPSVANMEHPLAGVEAASIRLRVSEAATDSESGESSMEATQ